MFISLIFPVTYGEDCLFPYCTCLIVDNLNSVTCEENQLILVSNETNNLDINLKLKGQSNLETMNNGILENITLVSLDLSNNKNDFESLMDTINTFVSLKVLNLSYNQISIIKAKQFERLINLEILDLSYNHIFYFETDAFNGDGLNNLLTLNLKGNQLFEIENRDLDNLPSLQSLNFDFNKIRRIRSKVFTALTNIVDVSVQNNRIKCIEDYAFKGLLNLKSIRLNNNKLNGVNSSSFEGLNLDLLNFKTILFHIGFLHLK